jgi:hypothetical protein
MRYLVTFQVSVESNNEVAAIQEARHWVEEESWETDREHGSVSVVADDDNEVSR